jgi:hypothetical protein
MPRLEARPRIAALTASLAASSVLAAAACGGGGKPEPKAPAPDPQVTAALAAIDQALAARPDDGMLLYHRASMTVAAGAPADALPFLARLDAAGWSVALSPLDFAPLAGDPRFREIAQRIDARDPPVHRSTQAFAIPGAELIPEGIAVDPASGTLYVGSIRKRTIVAIDAQRKVTPLVPPGRDGLMAVLGLRVDPTRGLLWAASNASESMEGYAPTDRGAHAVFAFALSDGTLRRLIPVKPAAAGERHLLNDLAIAPDGTVYVTDSEAGQVHRIPPERDVLEPVVPPRTFFYPNGIALAPSGKLYVAHATGIALVDPTPGSPPAAPVRLEAPPRVPLGGIDGLLLHEGALLGVQNAIGRPRLVRISLDERGLRATALTVLENDPRVFELPTTTAVHEGHAYTIGNSQLDALAPGGLRKDRPLHDPRIIRTPL